MKRKAFNTFLISIVSLLIIISFTAESIAFANAYLASSKNAAPEVLALTQKSSARVEMKVCVQTMRYYKNTALSGNPVDTKKFGDVVFAEKVDESIMCIYNKNGAMLGYCESKNLVSKDAKFFAEIPYEWNSSGQISNLVDLRKYILIFGADVICDSDEPVLIQYDTATKLFRAASEIKKAHGYTLCVDEAYVPASEASSEKCCTLCSHSKGCVLTLSVLKNGESISEKIPLYDEENTASNVASKLTKLLADFSLLRDAESDCFYDADHESYISSDHGKSSLIYSVWE